MAVCGPDCQGSRETHFSELGLEPFQTGFIRRRLVETCLDKVELQFDRRASFERGLGRAGLHGILLGRRALQSASDSHQVICGEKI